MGGVISAYTLGSTFLPKISSPPVTTTTWYQAWDASGKDAFIFPLWVIFRGAYIVF